MNWEIFSWLSCFQLLVETRSCVSVQSTAHAGRVHWGISESVIIYSTSHSLLKKAPIALCSLGICPVISLLFSYLSLTKLYCKPPQLLKLHSITALNCLVGNNFKVTGFCIPLTLLSLFIWTAAVVASTETFHTSLTSDSTGESVRCSVSC